MFLKRLVGTNLVLPLILDSLHFLKFGKLTQSIPTSNVADQIICSLFQQIWADCRDLLNYYFVKAEFQIKFNCTCTCGGLNKLT